MNPAIQIIKNKFKQKMITVVELKQYVEQGTLSKRDILDYKFFASKVEYDLAFPVTKTEYLLDIKKGVYTDDQLKGLIGEGIVTEQDLVEHGIKSQRDLDKLFDRKVGYYNTEFDFSEVPAIRDGRTDVFVFGIAGSGKSSFMAGLMYFMYRNGLIDLQMNNHNGFVYMNSLINAIQCKQLPRPTAVNYVQHMECDVRDADDIKHPLTFIEMSGELFKNLYGKPKETMNLKLKEYLFDSPNNKVLFLTIDYYAHLSGVSHEEKQDMRFYHIVKFLETYGMLETVEAICILITKWDSSADQSQQAAEELLRQEYLSLYNLCKELSREKGLKFRAFCFSLGTFDSSNQYVYDDFYSKQIYEFLVSITPVRAQETRPGLFKRLLGG
jgi:hypothetical protein